MKMTTRKLIKSMVSLFAAVLMCFTAVIPVRAEDIGIHYELIYEKDCTCLVLAPSKKKNVIRYTTDGSAPTKDSTLYTGRLRTQTAVRIRAAEFNKKDEWVSGISVMMKRKCVNVEITASAKKEKYLVSLTTETDGAKIYYTVDGSKPTGNSQLYIKPFIVEKGTVVAAYAVKKDWKNSGYSRTAINKKTPVTPAGASEKRKYGDITLEEERVLELVNNYRVSNGLSELALDSALYEVAKVRVQELCASYGHARPDGRTCFSALTDAGFYYQMAAENIAWTEGDLSTPANVTLSWISSRDHRTNILTAGYELTAVCSAYSEGKTYWVQLFAKK